MFFGQCYCLAGIIASIRMQLIHVTDKGTASRLINLVLKCMCALEFAIKLLLCVSPTSHVGINQFYTVS